MAELGDVERKLQAYSTAENAKVAAEFHAKLNKAWKETPEAKSGKALDEAIAEQLDVREKLKKPKE